MPAPTLTKRRIVLAYTIAGIADVLQLPITAATFTGAFAIPGEMADIVIDFIAMGSTIYLLGFHWILLPSLLLEAIPGLDLLPTWTGCVAFVIAKRKKEEAQTQVTTAPVIDVQAETTKPVPPPISATIPPPMLPAPALTTKSGDSVERRLQELKELLEKKLISAEDYETKRQRILSEM